MVRVVGIWVHKRLEKRVLVTCHDLLHSAIRMPDFTAACAARELCLRQCAAPLSDISSQLVGVGGAGPLLARGILLVDLALNFLQNALFSSLALGSILLAVSFLGRGVYCEIVESRGVFAKSCGCVVALQHVCYGLFRLLALFVRRCGCLWDIGTCHRTMCVLHTLQILSIHAEICQHALHFPKILQKIEGEPQSPVQSMLARKRERLRGRAKETSAMEAVRRGAVEVPPGGDLDLAMVVDASTAGLEDVAVTGSDTSTSRRF